MLSLLLVSITFVTQPPLSFLSAEHRSVMTVKNLSNVACAPYVVSSRSTCKQRVEAPYAGAILWLPAIEPRMKRPDVPPLSPPCWNDTYRQDRQETSENNISSNQRLPAGSELVSTPSRLELTTASRPPFMEPFTRLPWIAYAGVRFSDGEKWTVQADKEGEQGYICGGFGSGYIIGSDRDAKPGQAVGEAPRTPRILWARMACARIVTIVPHGIAGTASDLDRIAGSWIASVTSTRQEDSCKPSNPAKVPVPPPTDEMLVLGPLADRY
ncbi:uncharacterized protein EV422DRAFT_509349 [Fimicolochytrium jonesii]|uniref:uncharacterized protein n=1 Tax=Fimicolochytrium jonesii TaxID=1396493 RepID=UPI0022FE073A|nr:uncharacterized protein EV422DRAFT_509349 [Fimicolochytrium jonesii]KAI8816920.1 hypothetical protein EV422DRAFT_509349 [Fimicolochytrium jonesii]